MGKETTINHEKRDKIQGIAFDDMGAAIETLNHVFERRKLAANLLLQNPTDTGMANTIEYFNDTIRKVLYL